MKYRSIGLLAGMLICLLLSGCTVKPEAVFELSPESGADSVPEPAEATEERAAAVLPEETIVVYICGAVRNPGVYTLPCGSRAVDAVDAAGGFLPEAAAEYLNLAQILNDGQQITVYTADEVRESAEAAGGSDGAHPEKVNLNRADKALLMTLPGIGETRAEAILAYRREHGLFSSLEDVKNVNGIKEKLFEKIKDYIEI